MSDNSTVKHYQQLIKAVDQEIRQKEISIGLLQRRKRALEHGLEFYQNPEAVAITEVTNPPMLSSLRLAGVRV
jgi:hypothetical protein